MSQNYLGELLRTFKIHNVFHVSLLKLHVGQHVQVLLELPPMDKEGHIIYVPESIVGFKDHVLWNRVYVEYLIKWKGLPEYENSWQLENIVQEHPYFPTELIVSCYCCTNREQQVSKILRAKFSGKGWL